MNAKLAAADMPEVLQTEIVHEKLDKLATGHGGTTLASSPRSSGAATASASPARPHGHYVVPLQSRHRPSER
nr:unnamed protein product [Digitaria exilis]